MSKGWDTATLKKLKALTTRGLSTAEIGRRLGLTKNAVVGKLNRLGWNAKAESGATEKTVTKVTKPATTAKKTTVTKATPKKAPAAKPAVKATTPPKKVTKPATKTAKPAEKATATQKKPTSTAEKPTKATKAAPAKEPTVDKKPTSKDLAMHQRIIQHSLEMAQLKANQCRWPIGDPDSEDFHFCGETVFVGKPYCYEHCKCAYQFTPPKKK